MTPLINDWVRRGIDCFIAIWALLSRRLIDVRLATYRQRQTWLRFKYTIGDGTSVRGYDAATRANINARYVRMGRTKVFAYTSGSTREPKRIAYDERRIRRTLIVFVDAMFRALADNLPANRTFFAMTPGAAGGPSGSLTNLMTQGTRPPAYLEGLQAPHRMQDFPALQQALRTYGETAVWLWLMAIANPGLIYATNPSTIATFFRELEKNWDRSRRLVSEYFSGCSKDMGGLRAIHRRIASAADNERLKNIASAVEHPPIAELFPGLRAFCCWDGGYVRPFIDQIRRFLPETRYRHVPMYSMSTEVIETVPVRHQHGTAFLPLAPGVLFEFIEEGKDDSAVNLLPANRLRSGSRYSMIVSDNYGLRRYHTDDVFECRGMVNGVPDLRFLGRRNLSYSFTGEKVTAEQLSMAFDRTERQIPQLRAHGFLTCFPSFAESAGCPYYRVVFVAHLLNSTVPAGEIAAVVQTSLSEINLEYRSKVKSGRLGAMQVTTLSLDSFVNLMVRSNRAKASQFKFLPLYPVRWEELVSEEAA